MDFFLLLVKRQNTLLCSFLSELDSYGARGRASTILEIPSLKRFACESGIWLTFGSTGMAKVEDSTQTIDETVRITFLLGSDLLGFGRRGVPLQTGGTETMTALGVHRHSCRSHRTGGHDSTGKDSDLSSRFTPFPLSFSLSPFTCFPKTFTAIYIAVTASGSESL